MRPRRDSGPEVQYIAYLVEALCQLSPNLIVSRYRLHPSLWPEVAQRHTTHSLRQLAREYGVSHEAVRRTLKVAEQELVQ
jgi:DNA-binding winged helix-turn-helix (wHTH) protein